MNLSNRDDWVEILWRDTIVDQNIWLKGSESIKGGDGHYKSVFRAYGPHKVVDKKKKILSSGTPSVLGSKFMYYSEDLLIPRD